MRTIPFVALLVVAGFIVTNGGGATVIPNEPSVEPDVNQSSSLCAGDERVIFSCSTKPAAKLVSLCASHDFGRDRGYLQYRFGLPGKVELEFPSDRKDTQKQFRYSHYFRAQVDRTEISFSLNGYDYTVFDDYNGEEKPAKMEQGVSVASPGKPKETNFICRGKPKADYSALADALPNEDK